MLKFDVGLSRLTRNGTRGLQDKNMCCLRRQPVLCMSTSGFSMEEFDEDTQNFNATLLPDLARRIEDLKKASTTHFLQYGFQASVLERKREDLMDIKPELPTTEPITWHEASEGHALINDWHENAWLMLREASQGTSTTSSADPTSDL
ncbi:hypothetical protein CEUSTIGMA_g8928.t1 [Chlamydomonas eustigma]|uniref:Uncharacterized protein n=1 Tax=Chlamydomonas eustigma TaxID=1157962 RepID=A0A250XFD4_9CHLO|nr:hypothetical protein CEUSTIGMA_g8928.t1 [Chlamydomonas eustigma]|eukprot:GAX81500.1 hypothetical protein CEUSTIGMA_g8928.t1 [Chlamydomonas eustigma]